MKIILILMMVINLSSFAQEDQNNTKKTKTKETEKSEEKKVDGLKLRYALGLFMSGLTVTSEDETIYGTLEVEDEYESVFGIVLEARYMAKNSWGIMGGITFESERDLETRTVTLGSTTVSGGVVNPPSIKLFLFNVSAVRQWEQFYLPFGLSYAKVDYTSSVVSDFEDAFGINLGFGYMFTENMGLDFITYVLYSSLTETATNGTVTDYDDLTLSKFDLTFKYVF